VATDSLHVHPDDVGCIFYPEEDGNILLRNAGLSTFLPTLSSTLRMQRAETAVRCFSKMFYPEDGRSKFFRNVIVPLNLR
jgi:hypothetical protein